MNFFSLHKKALLAVLSLLLIAVAAWIYNEKQMKKGKKSFLPFVKHTKQSEGRKGIWFGEQVHGTDGKYDGTIYMAANTPIKAPIKIVKNANELPVDFQAKVNDALSDAKNTEFAEENAKSRKAVG